MSEERISELNWLWAAETNDGESQEWRVHLSEEEAVLVSQWDGDYACGLAKIIEGMMQASERNGS